MNLSFLKKQGQRIDIGLLAVLLLLLDVKLPVKIAGLVLLLLQNRNLRLRFSSRYPAIPWFYAALIFIALANTLLFGLFRLPHYLPLLMTGLLYAIIPLLAFATLRQHIEKKDPVHLENTIAVFFILNAVVSAAHLLAIMLETGVLNPYRYQGMYQKYFIGTGDYIRGITFDTSTANAVLNAFGTIFFLLRKQLWMTLLCCWVMLLAGSNTSNVLLLMALLYVFVFRSDKDIKSIVLLCFGSMILFVSQISPQNNLYTIRLAEKLITGKAPQKEKPVYLFVLTEKPDSILTPEQRKQKAAQLYLDSIAALQSGNRSKPELLPLVNIHAPEYQHKPDSTAARMEVIHFMHQEGIAVADTVKDVSNQSGKKESIRQLLLFFHSHPVRIITGNGMGNFSSRLAFKATGLHIAGAYPRKWIYIHPDFKKYHLSIYLSYFGQDSGYHSILNSPNSVYAQLLGEYGLAGLMAFVFGYFWYFLRLSKRSALVLPLLAMLLGFCLMDYWLEQLSVFIFFELLVMIDIRKQNSPTA
jgi:hypothetical protein